MIELGGGLTSEIRNPNYSQARYTRLQQRASDPHELYGCIQSRKAYTAARPMTALDWRGKLSRILLKEVSITCMGSTVTLEANDTPGIVDTVWRGTSVGDLNGIVVWDMSHNQLTDCGLLHVIQQTTGVHSDTLQRINLSYNYISNRYLPELRVWLDQFPNVVVDLRYNSMTEEDVKDTPALRKITIIQGVVESRLSTLEETIEERSQAAVLKVKKHTQENLACVLEESIIPFMESYLTEKGLPHVMVVNRDPNHKPSRELHAPTSPREKKKGDIVREYDGLFVVQVGPDIFLLNNATQIHLTKNKLDRVIEALRLIITAMLPAWRRNPESKLRRRCPTALEKWITDVDTPRLRLMVTYFTIDEDIDIVAEADRVAHEMDVQFVQFDLFNLDNGIPSLKAAIDDLLQ
jgi:hypothetical protein